MKNRKAIVLPLPKAHIKGDPKVWRSIHAIIEIESYDQKWRESLGFQNGKLVHYNGKRLERVTVAQSVFVYALMNKKHRGTKHADCCGCVNAEIKWWDMVCELVGAL